MPAKKSPAKSATKAAKVGRMPGLHAVLGSDEAMVRERSIAIYNELTGGNDDGFTHEVISGAAENPESAYQICMLTLQALQTLPMFGGDKVVWLKHANFVGDGRTAEAQRTLAGVDRLREVITAGLPAGVSLLISATSIDKRRSLWKFLSAAAKLELHEKIDTGSSDWADQAAQLTVQRADRLDLEFDRDAMEIFVMRAGESSGQISGELEKLDLYLGPERRQVTAEDVRGLVPVSRSGIIFEIGKALQAGDARRAIEAIDEQLAVGEAPIALIRASIIPTVRNLFAARLIQDELGIQAGNYQSFAAGLNRLPGSSRGWLPMKKDGSGVNVYPIFLCCDAAKRFTLEGLKRAMVATQAADQALVSSGLDARFVLHRLIVEIASLRIEARSVRR